MATFETLLQTFSVDYQCDQCKGGLMRPHGDVAWMADPLKYKHRCTNVDCGAEQTFLVQYPYLSYKEIK